MPHALALLALDRATAEHARETGVERGLHVVHAEVVGDQGAGDGPSSADVYVFESIGGWFGVTADDFVRDVAALDVEHIDLHLNSPGGSALEGSAIANVLRQHKASVTVWVDGLAASAASIIATAGDEVVMGLGSQLMVHNPWTATAGDSAEMRKAAEMLDSTASAMATAYAAKAGGTSADWRAVMDAETWYGPEEAVASGLADRVATEDDNGRGSGQQVVPGSSSSMGWDMWDSVAQADRHRPAAAAAFRYAGREQAPPPKTPAATASGLSHGEGSAPVSLTDEQLATLRTKLGLAADASPDDVVASVTEVMEKFTEDDALPPGTVAIDAHVLADMRSKAEAGAKALAHQQAEQRSRLVEAAISDGRITPANRDAWLTKLEKDPGGATDLASLAPGLVPLSEVGNSSGDVDDIDRDYEGLFGRKAG